MDGRPDGEGSTGVFEVMSGWLQDGGQSHTLATAEVARSSANATQLRRRLPGEDVETNTWADDDDDSRPSAAIFDYAHARRCSASSALCTRDAPRFFSIALSLTLSGARERARVCGGTRARLVNGALQLQPRSPRYYLNRGTYLSKKYSLPIFRCVF